MKGVIGLIIFIAILLKYVDIRIKFFNNFISIVGITISKKEDLPNSSKIIIDDVNKKLYIYRLAVLSHKKVKYTEINYSDITGCKIFINGEACNMEYLQDLTSSIKDDALIYRAGIDIFTNDTSCPNVTVTFFKKKAKKDYCDYEIRKVREWGTALNSIAIKNGAYAM